MSRGRVRARSPGAARGRSAWRRLRRNRLALGALALFILIVAVSFAAPLYADHIAHTDPFDNNLNGTTIVNGKEVPMMQQGGGVLHLGETPIGPTWDVHHYFLGADTQGRDVAARLLYGGRTSLLVGIGSARSWLLPRDGARADRGVLRRHRRRAAVAPDGRDLGLPRLSCSRSASRPSS